MTTTVTEIYGIISPSIISSNVLYRYVTYIRPKEIPEVSVMKRNIFYKNIFPMLLLLCFHLCHKQQSIWHLLCFCMLRLCLLFLLCRWFLLRWLRLLVLFLFGFILLFMDYIPFQKAVYLETRVGDGREDTLSTSSLQRLR